MSKRAPRKNKGGITEEQLSQLKTFKLDDRLAMETLLRIEDRDHAGRMINFKLNFAQAELHQMWEKIRALNIVLSVKDRLQLLSVLSLGEDPGLRALVESVYSMNTSTILLELRKRKIEVSDGPVRCIIGKPRQVGISTYVQGRFFIKSMFSENFSTNVTAHKESAAQNVLRKSKLCYDYWPSEYAAIRTQADSNSRDGMQFAHNSRFVAQTSGGA